MQRYLYISFVFVFTVLVLMSSCNKGGEVNKEAQLQAYKNELRSLEEKIDLLQASIQGSRPVTSVYVEASRLEPQVFEDFVEVSGSVAADKNILISPEIAGKIMTIAVQEGDRVKKGQVLARLNSEAQERALEQVKINLNLARTIYERQSKLWKQQIGSEIDYLQAQTNMEALEQQRNNLQAQVALAVLRAPIDGVIDELIQKQGEMGSPQLPFARLLNLDQVYVEADMSELYLPKMNDKDEVSLTFPVLGKNIQAFVFRKSAMIDPKSRTFRVRINLDNKDGDLKPNMLAVLKLKTFSKQDALVVPSILIRNDIEGSFLYVVAERNGKSFAEKRYVEISLNTNNHSLVEKGLQPGDRIISKGYAQVVDGSLLSISE